MPESIHSRIEHQVNLRHRTNRGRLGSDYCASDPLVTDQVSEKIRNSAIHFNYTNRSKRYLLLSFTLPGRSRGFVSKGTCQG